MQRQAEARNSLQTERCNFIRSSAKDKTLLDRPESSMTGQAFLELQRASENSSRKRSDMTFLAVDARLFLIPADAA